ncbi:hypothetical protein [Marininema halotolerans]|uniref:Uncharacterized protein n=1 Tax=Marininema halotolerans TaxID=1155944 RepID=A0A1I6NWM8_9BACL|nr:hypothetical protein [Marininema halotolerans]SFS32248.1 hypothetical protein SAMN05444972_101193 [Marininema halotolerans]
MRTATLALIMCFFAFIAAPSAFADNSTEPNQQPIQAIYSLENGQHHVQVTLPHAVNPQGNWILTLNGSDEQSSPDASPLRAFTANYNDLVPGRTYQVIAVWYGKNNGQAMDLNSCFQFQAEDPATHKGTPTKLVDCGFKNPTSSADTTDQPPSKFSPEKKDPGTTLDAPEKTKATDSEEQSNQLDNLNSASKEGGKLPHTTVPAPWGSAGIQLILVGCALMGRRQSSTHQ